MQQNFMQSNRRNIPFPTVKIVRVNKETFYYRTAAQNLGVEFISNDRFMKIDTDVSFTTNQFFKLHPLEKNTFYVGDYKLARTMNEKYTHGNIYLFKSDFLKIRGYNELILSYGYDDSDLSTRLQLLLLQRKYFDLDTIYHNPHSVSLRQKNLSEILLLNNDESENNEAEKKANNKANNKTNHDKRNKVINIINEMKTNPEVLTKKHALIIRNLPLWCDFTVETITKGTIIEKEIIEKEQQEERNNETLLEYKKNRYVSALKTNYSCDINGSIQLHTLERIKEHVSENDFFLNKLHDECERQAILIVLSWNTSYINIKMSNKKFYQCIESDESFIEYFTNVIT